jgi:hypothetical protein
VGKLVKMHYPTDNPEQLAEFLKGRSGQSLLLFDHFLAEFAAVGPVTLHPAKTMIGISNRQKRIAWVTQFGKSFLHVVFPFKQPYNDNLCFQKIAQVPDDNKQFNHHFRMLKNDDINDEVKEFMQKAWNQD